MMALAEFEREQTSERNKDTTLARAERGLWNGGRLIGYDLNPDKKGQLLVNEKEKLLVQFAFKNYLQCGAIIETVKRLNANDYRTKEYTSRRNKFTPAKHFAYTSVHRILTNCAYTGKKEINKKWKARDQETLPEKQRYRLAPAVWAPLIDEQTFNQTQLLLSKNYNSKHNSAKMIRHVYMLNNGKLQCGICGSEMEGGSGTGQHRQKYYYYLCKNLECKFRVPATEIEDFVIAYIKELAVQKDSLREIITATNGKLHKELPQLLSQRNCLQKELNEIKNFAQGILDQWTNMATDENALFIKDKLSELGKRRKEIENGIETLGVMIEEIERESVNQEMVELMVAKFGEIFDSIKPYQQKELINLILHRACLNRTDIKIALYGKQTDTRLFDLAIPQGANDLSRPGISDWLPELVRNKNFYMSRQDRALYHLFTQPYREYKAQNPQKHRLGRCGLTSTWRPTRGGSYAHVSQHFKVSRARVSQFIGIVTKLPEEFIVSMKKCEDPDLLRTFSGKELIRISRLPSPEQREEEINRLATL